MRFARLALLPLAAASPAPAERLPYATLAAARPGPATRLPPRPPPAPPPPPAERLPYATLDEAEPELAQGFRLEYALLDRLEWAPQRGRDGYAWDVSALTAGTDALWLSSVGEGSLWGSPGSSDFPALSSRTLALAL